MIGIECDEWRIDKRIETGYVDHKATSLDEAMQIIEEACAAKSPVSVGLLGNAAELLPKMIERGIRPDMVTDQTSATIAQRLSPNWLDARRSY